MLYAYLTYKIFVDLAQSCAPAIEVQELAAIVSVQSTLDPYAIRTNSSTKLKAQPKSIDEAVKLATRLAMSGEDIELGLGGVTVDALNAEGKGIKDAFDPCENLKITSHTLIKYQSSTKDRQEALAMFYGRGDTQAGKLAGYAKVIDHVSAKLSGKLETLQLKPGTLNDLPVREWTGTPVNVATTTQPKAKHNSQPTASWDVFGKSKSRANVFFLER